MGDARFAEKLRMDDQIQQWSRPADERDGRPLTDHRIEDAVARGDAQITQSKLALPRRCVWHGPRTVAMRQVAWPALCKHHPSRVRLSNLCSNACHNTGINTSDAFLLESIMSLDKPEQQVIANADAQLLEQLQRQDKEFRYVSMLPCERHIEYSATAAISDPPLGPTGLGFRASERPHYTFLEGTR